MRRRPSRAGGAGFTLVELLVASTVSAVLLAAAWAWLWNVAPVARAQQQDAQARSAAAFALRVITGDLQEATAILTPIASAPDGGLLLQKRRPGAALETLVVVWDPSRQVLWRKTSSIYLADHVSRFSVACYDAGGERLQGPAGQPLPAVARVHIEVEVQTGGDLLRSSVDVAVRTT